MTLEIINGETEIKGILSGRLDTAASQQFSTDMQPIIDNANKHIILDCTNLDFISSSGLRLFLTILKTANKMKGDVTLTGMKEEIKQVFALTGFLRLFKVA